MGQIGLYNIIQPLADCMPQILNPYNMYEFFLRESNLKDTDFESAAFSGFVWSSSLTWAVSSSAGAVMYPGASSKKAPVLSWIQGGQSINFEYFLGLPSIKGNACWLSTYSVCTVFGHGTSTAIAVDCSESKPSASLNLNWSSRMILDDFGFPFSVLLILSKLVMTLRPSPCIVDHCPWSENQREGSPIPTELKIKCMVIRDSCSTSENP